MSQRYDLTEHDWNFKLSKEMPDINDIEFNDSITLPSTVSQQKKPTIIPIRNDGFLTDPYSFEGYALYQRTVSFSPDNGDCDIFLVLERTRVSRVWINGQYAGSQNSLCTQHRYDITPFFTTNDMSILIMIDNISYPVPGGHMTSRDTQTNWLGITGGVYIECKPRIRLENVKIFPDTALEQVKVTYEIIGSDSIDIEAVVNGFPKEKFTLDSKGCFIYEMKGAELWSEHTPFSYTMEISYGGHTQKTDFGMREFSVRDGRFLLNGRRIFLRGKHDGMIFPLTGAAPCDVKSWTDIFKTAKSYGINHYRFHTCCPPEAAFCAADAVGIYLEPELPFWGTVDDEITEGQQYLIDEGYRILDAFANHPSFFALSLGNELWGSKERLNDILGGYKKYDSRPLYTQGSNNFQFVPCVLENDDFFVGVRFSKERLIRGSYAMCDAPLGHIQTCAPCSDYTYDENIHPSRLKNEKHSGGSIEIQYGTGVKTVSADATDGELIPRIPVVSHEVGQYFMYPDYKEIRKYLGVLKPYNLEIFRERLDDAGLVDLADSYFRASGRFAAECYKNELETALRTSALCGFQLLDLQDFTGQGSAFVGILNAFMENKGLISEDEWRGFCSDKVLLGCMKKFVYTSGEKMSVNVKLYTYSQLADVDPEITLCLSCDGSEQIFKTVSSNGTFEGGVFDIGTAEFIIPHTDISQKAVLTLTYKDTHFGYTRLIRYAAIITALSLQTSGAMQRTLFPIKKGYSLSPVI